MPEHLVIVGAALAGLRAVEAARRSGYKGGVTMIGAESQAPYDRPPLSKEYLAPNAESGAPELRSAQSLHDDFGADLKLGVRATGLNCAAQQVHTDHGALDYTALIIATGSAARPTPWGDPLPGVYTLRTVDDARRIRADLDNGAQDIVIIGAGFIGSEAASAMHRRGLKPIIIEHAPVPLAHAIGEEMGIACAHLHRRNGTELRCGVGVGGIEGDDRVRQVRLTDGSALPADLVIAGIGAAPATQWLEGSEVKVDNGVICDETLFAGAPGVYAAGDVARWPNSVFEKVMRLEHWTNATEQGKAAAVNALDPENAKPFQTVPYFWSDWYGNRLQFVGIPEADEIHVASGSIDSDCFLALYRQNSRLVGALGLNERRRVMKLRREIAQNISWGDAVSSVS
ncbi:NAD(P)/FAD-dependent oxidoreductase [Hoyosella subflava]|uniref:Putative FAD-dependent oxidoreductase n=1 Tax=Hoyosella subflava (strain DSM 45089 / JCM 17490 / NBRC 109087 / DQS3-9A1) TaxID=443218 RepID=F6EK18_HOYSD|nr:FAD/NAD(P)-binding oxidoreductase [Hoyosella subflava]AEF41376.1 putative FAD-dependent oxidoreductase [Hoyosella subflava DQS3-9A1]